MDSREELAWLRQQAAAVTNDELQRANMAERVDHRSNIVRGLVSEPTEHLGPAATALERAGQSTEAGDRNRRRRRRRTVQKKKDAMHGLSFFQEEPRSESEPVQPAPSLPDQAVGDRLRALAQRRAALAAPSLVRAVRRGAKQAERLTQTLLED